jgi:hypothetical protein
MKKALVLVLMTFVPSSWAGESYFSRVYSTDTIPKNHFEIKQSLRYRNDRNSGAYSAFDGRSEFEYGLQGDSQLSVVVNTGSLNASKTPDEHLLPGETAMTRATSFVQGVALELIYRVLSPVKDDIGLAFLFQPHVDFVNPRNGLKLDNAQGCEVRLLVQKNFLDDQLSVLFNTVGNLSTTRYQDESLSTTVVNWNNELGVSYRFASSMFFGLEARSQTDHSRSQDGSSSYRATYWVGPALHYGGMRCWLTLGTLRQVYGVPSGRDDQGRENGDNLQLRANEKWETTFKIGIPF